MNASEQSIDSRPEARHWRERVARAAVRRVGDVDAGSITTAMRIVDRGVIAAAAGFGVLGLLGALAGWTTTAELMRPAEVPVHAPLLLATLVLVPWSLMLLRWLVLKALRTRGRSLLGRLVPFAMVRGMWGGREDARGDQASRLTLEAGYETARMLAAGSGRRLAAAGGGLFWVTFAVAAIATIWLSSARVAYGFGWESSWLSPSIGEATTRIMSAPLSAMSIGPEADTLVPIAAAPDAPADDVDALDARRAWIRFLSVGIGFYLLLPMGLLTIVNAAIGHLLAERWRPSITTKLPEVTQRRTAPAARNGESAPSADRSDADAASHRVTLERPSDTPLPESLARLQDLGSLDAADDATRLTEAMSGDHDRLVVLAWLPATPDRGVRRRLRAVAANAVTPPLVVLDGGTHLRDTEPAATASIRLDDWHTILEDLGCPWIECDLGSATASSLRLLEAAVAGKEKDSKDPRNASSSDPADLSTLDDAFAAIGRFLPDSTTEGPTLPGDDGLAACLLAVAEAFKASPATTSIDWSGRLGSISRTLADVSASPGTRIESIRSLGMGFVPAAVRNGAIWTGVGGLLGVAACAAAATVAPAALVAIPGWAGTGAGIAGLLSLLRSAKSDTGSASEVTDHTEAERSLGDAVFGAAAASVLWWSQAADEARTTRLLEALAADDESTPVLEDAAASRLWLAAARQRIVACEEGGS
ncbi:MAG: hypothetical protein CMJ34_05750 [Phycisphaerae bacterium]|nr:hypothetical protein [Phycisphaerae bacterium]